MTAITKNIEQFTQDLKETVNQWFLLIPEKYRVVVSAVALFLLFFFIIRYDFKKRYVFGKNIRPKGTKNILGFKVSVGTIHAFLFMVIYAFSILLSFYYYQQSKK
ncbi:hypothetical protein [Flavobacterium panacagri]|uniref:hypothetical protein n=1 Tax=Flavobacterium panacagri TaxID=3034146 RepID=UPI0025A54AE8|nr:hypothetical protein [Flavobacterium panacagri]